MESTVRKFWFKVTFVVGFYLTEYMVQKHI